MRGEKIVPAPMPVIVSEPVAPIVSVPAKLSLTRFQLHNPFIRLDPEIVATQFKLLPGNQRLDYSSAPAIGQINPIIQSVFKTIDPMLLVSLMETGEQHFLDVCLSVAVCVLRVDDVGCGADQHAFAPRHDAIRKAQPIQENRRLVVNAVASGVLE